jgi:hypothetical protein
MSLNKDEIGEYICTIEIFFYGNYFCVYLYFYIRRVVWCALFRSFVCTLLPCVGMEFFFSF